MREILTQMPADYPLVHRWRVAPRIRLEGKFLVYDPLPSDPVNLRLAKQPNSRLLYDFVALADASAPEIETYAKQWGPLGLCCHGVPTGRAYGYHADNLPPGHWTCPETRREPLDRWRTNARMFGWHVELIEQFRAQTNPQTARRIASQVSAHVNHFATTFGYLRPVVVPAGSGFTLRVAGSLAVAGLAAALAYQLMVAVTGGNGWLICAECGRWFQSDTRRSPDRNAYCPKCGRAAAMRVASRTYYRRKKQEGKRGKETQQR
jgi:hypothetical protein